MTSATIRTCASTCTTANGDRIRRDRASCAPCNDCATNSSVRAALRARVTKSNLGVVVCAGKVLLLDGVKDNCVEGGILMDTVARDDLDTLLDVVRHPLFESLVRVLIEDDVLQPHHEDAYEDETLAALYANNLVITMPPPL